MVQRKSRSTNGKQNNKLKATKKIVSNTNNHSKNKRKATSIGMKTVKDIYSDEENEEEENRENAKMDIDGVYEYEQPDVIPSDQDSEIDEDEAFNSQDEDEYGAIFNTKTNKKDEYSDSDDVESEHEGDLLSDLLGSKPGKRLPTTSNDNEMNLISALEDANMENSDEEEDEDVLARKQKNLIALVDEIAPSKGKKKKQMVQDIETSVIGTGTGASTGGMLTLSSLLGTSQNTELDEDDSVTRSKTTSSVLNLTTIKKQMQTLESESNTHSLQAALAPIQEERATRKLVYATKSEDLEMFQTVVRRNRLKDTMDFREQKPKMDNLTAAALTAKFSATTDLELQVQNLLETSALTDKRIAEDEALELEAKKVNKEEIIERQKELSKLRALMFYDEQKAKRIKKIKSKLYHKIRNHQNEKEKTKAHEQLRKMDPEMAKQLDEELAAKRAEERMSFKHTNTSKWVKRQLKRGINADENTRHAITEQLLRGEKLRKRMTSTGRGDESSDEDVFDDDADPDENAVSRVQRVLTQQANALVTDIENDENDKNIRVKGLGGMKFMQRAVAKQREKAKIEVEKLLQEIKGEGLDGLDSSDDTKSDADTTKALNTKSNTITSEDKTIVAKLLSEGAMQTSSVSSNKGIISQASGAIPVDLGNGVVGSTSVTVVSNDENTLNASIAQTQVKSKEKSTKTEPTTMENPWLSVNPTATKSRNKKRKKFDSTSNTSRQNASALPTKDVSEAMDIITKATKDTVNQLNENSSSKSTKKRKTKKQKVTAEGKENDSKNDSTKNTNNLSVNAKQTAQVAANQKNSGNNVKANTTEDLVRRAFAYANEDEDELALEKERLAEQDTEVKKGKEIATLMGVSGWGSWAGEGTFVSKRQKQREKMAHDLAAKTKANVLASRKDAKLAKVLLNEKKDRKASKFTCKDVPYPFTSRAEYEMAMRNPLGADWNTSQATNTLTAPKIITRAGQAIQPLVLSKEEKKAALKGQSKQRAAKF